MNGYERRKEVRKGKARGQYARTRAAELMKRNAAANYYIEAFIALNAQPPLVIPSGSVQDLKVAADIMYARLHEIEMESADG